jgi:protein tyrosine/serine phosphatase
MKKWLLYGSVFAVALAVPIGGSVWWYKSQPYHFEAVTPGKLYRSGTLRPKNLRKVIDECSIKTVISLRTEGERQMGDWYQHERAICQEKGVKLLHIPIDEPPSTQHVDEWLDLVTSAEHLPILVHCKLGAVRTSVMVAIYEMEILRKDNEKTLAELSVFGHSMHKPNRHHLRDYILQYAPRWSVEPE